MIRRPNSSRNWIVAAALVLLAGACSPDSPRHAGTAFDAAKALLDPSERQLFDSDPEFRKQIGPRLVQNAECLKYYGKKDAVADAVAESRLPAPKLYQYFTNGVYAGEVVPGVPDGCAQPSLPWSAEGAAPRPGTEVQLHELKEFMSVTGDGDSSTTLTVKCLSDAVNYATSYNQKLVALRPDIFTCHRRAKHG
jgi:hypothetical protein